MGYELEADVNLVDPAAMVATSEALMRVIRSLAGAPEDVISVDMQVYQDAPIWKANVPADGELPFDELFSKIVGPNRYAYWNVFLDLPGTNEGILPGLSFHGEPDPKQRDWLAHGQRHDAWLSLAKERIFTNRSKLTSGKVIDPDWAIQLLTGFCLEANVRDLFLHAEAQISFPPSYHGVYHLDPAAYVDDLFDMVRIALHGGEGYTDGRRSYTPAVVTDGGQYFYFGEIKRSEADRVCAMLTRLGGVVEREPERLTRLTAADVRAAIQRCPGMIVRENDLGGLAVFPDKFPDVRIAPLYYHLLQEFAGP